MNKKTNDKLGQNNSMEQQENIDEKLRAFNLLK